MYTMSRFDFLKSKDQKLYKLCVQVEERVNDDADVFMLKCRRALECVVTVAGCNGKSLYEKVNDIKNNLQISREMQHEIFALKDMCNENIHFEEKSRSEVDVAGTIAKLEHICHWLVDAIIDKQVKTVISDNVNVLREKMRELEDAFKRNDFEAITALNEEIKALSTKQREDIHVIKYGDEIDADELYKQAEQKYDEEEYEEAFKLFMESAEKGHAGAQYKIGEEYYYGYGVKENIEEAVKWYKLAAKNGYVDAYYDVGYAYHYGEGVKENKEEAVRWYKLAAENGNGYAESRLESLNKNSIKPTLNKNNVKSHKRCMPCIFYENQYCKYKRRYTGVYDKACDFYVEMRSECCKSCLHYDGSRCKNIKCPFYNLYREINSKCLNYERE